MDGPALHSVLRIETLKPYTPSRRAIGCSPQNEMMQRRKSFKKPSSAGTSGPAKDEVRGPSVLQSQLLVIQSKTLTCVLVLLSLKRGTEGEEWS